MSVSMLMLGVLLLTTPSEKASAKKDIFSLALPSESPESWKTIETKSTLGAMPPAQPTPSPPPEHWQHIDVHSGDNLSTLFQRMGLSPRDVYEISQADLKQQNSSLKKLFPGEQLNFVIKEGRLKKLRRIKNPLETVEFIHEGDDYRSSRVIREPEINHRFVTTTLQSSLFLAGQKAGLSQKLIMELANIFGGVIDFVYDPRKGDSFSLLFEERFIDGKRLGSGRILAAQFTNQNETYSALLYTDSEGEPGYYSPEGVSMRKTFLRAPLDFTRISSGFNLKRRHPIHKSIRAHRGIDYAAPTGTPVFAAGDGRVTASGYSKANGKYVFIQHGEQYITKYLHLHKRSVKKGQRVKQQQVIGQVGATGYATGPHLHYEFLVSGVHRNPRTIFNKLPKAKSIALAEIASFREATRPLLAQLDQEVLLASNE